jgi:hypothetical protein
MPATQRPVIRTMCPMSCHPTLCGMLVEIEDGRLVNVMGDQDSLLSPAARHADLVLPVEAEPVSFVDAQCASQAIIATLLVEYGLRARERTEAGLGSFERLAVRHAFFHTDH